MKLILFVSIILSAAPALISSLSLSISKDILVPRVFTHPKPIRGEADRRIFTDPKSTKGEADRPVVSKQEIVARYTTFLGNLDRWPAKDAGNIWLPTEENKQDLFRAPSQGKSGVYVKGRIAVAQFGFDDLPAPAHNLLASGYTSWRPGDKDDSDKDRSNRQRSFKTLREKGRSVSSLLRSASAKRVQAEFKPLKYSQINPFETRIAFALERAAQLLAENFHLDSVQFKVSYSARQKQNNRRRLDSDMSTVARVLHRHNPTAQLQERSGFLDEIDQQEQSASHGSSNSTTDVATELELYQYALIAVQNNISDLLFPFLDTITAKTNSDLVYDVLWSVFQDLTGISNFTGPFMSGWHCLEILENQYANHTGSSSKNGDEDSEMLEYLAVHQVVLDIYSYAWTNGSAAANKTGLLNDMAALTNFLHSVNQSALPPNFLKQATPKYDYNYFRSRNRGGSSNTTMFFNFTLPKWE